MKYIDLIHFKDDESEVTTATTDEEIKRMGAQDLQSMMNAE